jgi:hypothetical protein
MPEGVEADTSKSRRRIITEEASDISMSRFMKGNGNKNWK